MLEHNMESLKSCQQRKNLQAYRAKNVQTYINQDIEAKAGRRRRRRCRRRPPLETIWN